MTDTTSNIIELAKNLSGYPHCAYGRFSRAAFEITMDGTLRVSISPKLPGMENQRGQVPKGTKVYDDDKKVAFTLNHADCAHIIHNWKGIRTGTYENKDSNVRPEYKNQFTLTHFSADKKPSNFSLLCKDGDVNKLVMSIRGQDGQSAQYMLSNDFEKGSQYSLNEFENVLKNVVTYGIFIKLIFQSIIKKVNFTAYNMGGNSNNNSGGYQKKNNNYNNSGNSNYNNNSNNYQKAKQNAPVSAPVPANSNQMADIDSSFAPDDLPFGNDDGGEDWTQNAF